METFTVMITCRTDLPSSVLIRKHSMSGPVTSSNIRIQRQRKRVPTTGRVDARRRPLTMPNLFQEVVTTRRSSGIGPCVVHDQP